MASNSRIEELKEKFDENPRRYFAPLANEYRKAGDPQQAIALCEMYLHQQPGHMSGHIVFGQALFEAGQLDRAKKVFEAALALDAENLIALKHLGDIARLQGDAYGARAWYMRVLEADPRNEEISGYLTELEAQGAASVTPSQTAYTPVSRPQEPMESAPPQESLDSVQPQESLGSEQSQESPEFEQPQAWSAAAVPVAEPIEFEPTSFAGEFEHSEAGAVDADLPLLDPVPASPEPELPDTSPLPELSEPRMPAAPFVTETMAELYLQQGHDMAALDVYEQLAAANPEDDRFRERVHSLKEKLAHGVSAAAPVEESVAPEESIVPIVEALPEPMVSSEPLESPAVENVEPMSTPEPVVAAPVVPAAPQETVREVFSKVGAYRPRAGAGLQLEPWTPPQAPPPRPGVHRHTGSYAPAQGGLDELFPAATPMSEDAAAAAMLARAFAEMQEQNPDLL